jgi:hypothetical protein
MAGVPVRAMVASLFEREVRAWAVRHGESRYGRGVVPLAR